MPSYRSARNRTLSRDGYRCRRCFRYRVPLTIHHIKSRREGGTNAAENLITLCCDCHALWHDGGHTTQWESFADFLGAEVLLSPWQSRLLQKCSPLRENQVCVRWPLSLEQLSERLWRWRWIDKPIGLMRKRKCGFVSYHFDFTLSRGPTIQSVRPYNDSGANGVHIVTVDGPWQIGCPLEIPHAPRSADGYLVANLVLSDRSRLCPATRTGSGSYLPRAPVYPIEPANAPADGLLSPEEIEKLLLTLSGTAKPETSYQRTKPKL